MANKIKFEKLINHLNIIIGEDSTCIMSQRELAKLLGISNVTVCRWINKERNIKLEDAIKVCNILGLNKEEYLDKSVHGYIQFKSPLEERISKLSKENQEKVFEYIDYLIYQEEHYEQTRRTK